MKTTNEKDIAGSYRTPDGKAQIDFGITYHNGYPEFSATGYYNGSSGQCIEEIAAAYEATDSTVQLLGDYHSVHHLKQVNPSHVAEVAALAENHPARSFFQDQAQVFLDRNGLKFRATLSDTKTPAWKQEGEACGHHYRVTISRISTQEEKQTYYQKQQGKMPAYGCSLSRLAFDFWGSLNDAETGKHPTPYDVLACISGDVYTPETFKDFCDEYGYDSDSLKALQTFRRCSAFAKRLRAFFTAKELEELTEIQ